MARRFRFDTSVAGPFVGRCISNLAMLRFHTPIIKPDLWYKLWGAKGTVVIVAADRVHRVTKGRLVIETAPKTGLPTLLYPYTDVDNCPDAPETCRVDINVR